MFARRRKPKIEYFKTKPKMQFFPLDKKITSFIYSQFQNKRINVLKDYAVCVSIIRFNMSKRTNMNAYVCELYIHVGI